jgi:hypothetical protein
MSALMKVDAIKLEGQSPVARYPDRVTAVDQFATGRRSKQRMWPPSRRDITQGSGVVQHRELLFQFVGVFRADARLAARREESLQPLVAEALDQSSTV